MKNRCKYALNLLKNKVSGHLFVKNKKAVQVA